jgi:hypothetical protein
MEIGVSLITVEMRRVGHSIKKMKRKNQIFVCVPELVTDVPENGNIN